jgi:hypothetical protein
MLQVDPGVPAHVAGEPAEQPAQSGADALRQPQGEGGQQMQQCGDEKGLHAV